MYSAYTAHFVTPALDLLTSVEDSVSITEVVTLFQTLSVAVSDNVSITESLPLKGPDLGVESTVGIAETVSAVLGTPDSILETIQISEAVSLILGDVFFVSDAISLSETVGSLLALNIDSGNSFFSIFFRRQMQPWLD